MTVILANARLVDGRIVDIEVVGGLIASVTPVGRPASASTIAEGQGPSEHSGSGVERHDLRGWLVVAAMAEPHAHLDKALTAEAVPNPTGDLMGAINAWNAAATAGTITHEAIVERASAAIELLLVHGVTAVRSHANVLASTGASAVIAVREAADRFRDLIDVQIVALTGMPIIGPDGAPGRRALAEALEVGVDLVGGTPHLQPEGTEAQSIAFAIEVATEAGIGIDLHVDEMLDPAMLTLRDLARQIIDTGFEQSVTASHCVTLGMQTPDTQAAVAAEVAEAGISVISLPQTNLFLQGRDHPTATPRGLTAIKALQDAGVTVAAGADNVQDPFNLVGRSDPLETASLLVMAGHQLPDTAFELVSKAPRSVLGLAPVTFAVGDPADIVAIDAPSVRGAMADAPMSRRVFRRGVLVASADQQTSIHRP